MQFIEASFWVLFGSALFGFYALILSSPFIYFGRHRAQWQLRELLAFVLPLWTWVTCHAIDSSGKSMSNMAVETLWLMLATVSAVVLRVAIGHPNWRWRSTIVLTIALCCIGVGLWALVPPLPE